MKIASMITPKGYSGIARGTPRIITVVRPIKTKVAGKPGPIEHVVVLDVTSLELSVEMALNPGTCVVVVVAVVPEVTVVVE
ncbi:MAG: hypothetical protein ACLP5V_06055 [Candidatus Bathyarchaeia archaeon]